MKYIPQIELHPVYIVKCKKCKEFHLVRPIEGNIFFDLVCDCGHITTRKRIYKSPIAYYWDCDVCGNEIFNALPYDLDENGDICLEQGINVQCPICFTKYAFDEQGIGHEVQP